MKFPTTAACALVLFGAFVSPPARSQTTAFTYQGRLNDGANPASGIYDLRFTIYAASSGGSAFAGPITNAAAAVSNGLFTVTLDFGPGVFDGTERWLEISVRSNGISPFSTLAPRQQITPTPYAIRAAGVDAAGLAGTIPPSSLGGAYNNAVSFDNAANYFSGTFYGNYFGLSFIGGSFSGSFIGNGSGLANLNGSQITSGTIPSAALNNAWRPAGNTGTIPGSHFIGNIDNKPLEFRINNQRVMAIGTNANGSPNFIAGSPANSITGTNTEGSTISGGGIGLYPNTISASYATIGGGTYHRVNGAWSTIAGGRDNVLHADHAVIGGGYANWIDPLASYGTIAGGAQINIGTNAYYSFVGGGWDNHIGSGSERGTIAGGSQNQIGDNAGQSTISGGLNNLLLSPNGTIGGGQYNSIEHSGSGSTIGGGVNNLINGTNFYVTIGGGNGNGIGPNSYAALVAGGQANLMDGSAAFSTLGGGVNNRIGFNSPGAVIAGGINNLVRSNSSYATIPGGVDNSAASYAFAAGNRAKAQHQGAFVWADAQPFDFASSNVNEVAFRASGGVRFTSGGGGANQIVSWTPGSGSWSFTSDRNTKENLSPVDSLAVLDKLSMLPLHEWNYIGFPQRHIGPMAQDFHTAFPLNESDTTLNTADLQGVALAAIQGLNHKLQQKEAEITELKTRLDKLEKILQNRP